MGENALRHPILFATPLAVLVAGCACLSTDMVTRVDLREAVASPAEARGAARSLLAAGGGEPRTGYIGASVQGLFPSSAALSSGISFDVNYTANLQERFSVEMSLGRVSYDLSPGNLKAMTLGAIAQFGMPFGAARWYAGGGLTYWMNDLSGAGAEADDSLGLVVAAGADLPITTSGNLCIELRYILADADLSTGGALDLNAFGVRVNYVFKY
jgi:hypothetical protein